MNNKRDRNILDDEWYKAIKKLLEGYSRLRLSKEDEDLIIKITNKL